MYEARSFARQGKQYSKMRDLSAEYTDGTTALYRVNPDGSIYLDKDSVLVREMFCLHCGEQMNTALDAATGTQTHTITTAPLVDAILKSARRTSEHE